MHKPHSQLGNSDENTERLWEEAEPTDEEVERLFAYTPGLSGCYTLAEDGTTAVPCRDLMQWAEFMSEGIRRYVAHDEVGPGTDPIRVSTVFLGVAHPLFGEPPKLWETMVWGGTHDGHQVRYASHADALAGHEEVANMVEETYNKEWREWFDSLTPRQQREELGGEFGGDGADD